MQRTSIIVVLLWAVGYVVCHGGNFAAELSHRREYLEKRGASLREARDQCARGGIDHRELYERAIRDIQVTHDLDGAYIERALPDYNHTHYTGDKYTVTTDPHEIFQKYNTCALSPDVTEGPFYVEGELVRRDIVDGQPGVPLHLKIRVKDFATCADVSGALVEVWHANALGTYSGTGAEHGKTYLRGLQRTDGMGVVSFDTVFPGHYYERAPHVHVAVHVSGTREDPDGAVRDNVVSLSAQVFFDQDLILAVERQEPYRDNEQPFMYNADDGFLQQEAAARFDPFVDWVALSENANDGLLAWITVGANLTEHRELSVADHRP
ncbi:aromatic compound dioxygenase [Biscogniauxia mediterranea]|nr:aromatic compound dioxygenase [Biscogniauxia mediterranea]